MSNLAAMLRLPANLKSTQWQILAGPILILLILSMMVLPLPAFILDLLFTFNIALSIMVLLVAMFTQRTLEFAAFPTILLFTTLLRLALNVASTRIILMEGHTRRGGGWKGGRSVRSLPRRWQFRYRYRGVRHSRDHQLYGYHQRCRAYCGSGRALFSMVCRVSRWRLTPTLTPD